MTMTPTDLELSREDVISAIFSLRIAYDDLLAALSPFHPLGPPTDIRDRLYDGLRPEDEAILRDEVRAYLAAALVAAMWFGLGKGSGQPNGEAQAAVRAENRSIVAAHGGKGETLFAQLKRFTEIVERAADSDASRTVIPT